MSLSTTPAQGMGANYHHLHGLSQPNLLHCTEAEARKLATVDELLEALQAAKNTLVAYKLQPGPQNCWEPHDEENLAQVEAALAKVRGPA